MTTTQTEQEQHRQVARFALTRVLPEIDDFTKAYSLTVSVESGIFALLAMRLLSQGVSPERLKQLLQDVCEVYAAPHPADKAAPAPQAEAPQAAVAGSATIYEFPAPTIK